MTVLLIAVAGSVLLGAILLWISGYVFGSDGSGASVADVQKLATENKRMEAATRSLRQELAAAEAKAEEAIAEAKAIEDVSDASSDASGAGGAGDASDASSDASNEEIAELSSQLARTEGEKSKALLEVDNLNEEIEVLKEQVASLKANNKPTGLPSLKTGPKMAADDSSLDEVHAKLDMEKVTHQKTKDELQGVRKELEQVKKIAAARMASGGAAGNFASGGGKFKTMAIGMKAGGSGGDSGDVLRAALNKVQEEKRNVEADLERANKEIQLLKLRSQD